jgi:DNA-directed RNA polymerase subunit alpha
MSDKQIALPSKPKIVSEKDSIGVYEIEGLYPGYGHTLGNSLRRIILSSLPGAAVTQIKIKGVNHEFSTMEGVKEDVIAIILNIKKIRFALNTNENQTITVKVSGEKEVKAKDLDVPSQVTIANPDLHLFTITNKNTVVEMELTIEHGIGYVPKEMIHRERVDVGTIALDAIFAPIRRVYYETENMRVGDRTDFNKLRITIETDGTISPKNALENAIEIMISQLKAIVGFKEEFIFEEKAKEVVKEEVEEESSTDEMEDYLKTRIETLDLSSRTISALTSAGIRTVGGLARKKEEDILAIEGMGEKGLQEIKRMLGNHGIILK